MKKCDRCDGRGYLMTVLMPECDSCGGTGWVVGDFDFGEDWERERRAMVDAVYKWQGPRLDTRARADEWHRAAMRDVTTWKTWRLIGVWTDPCEACDGYGYTEGHPPNFDLRPCSVCHGRKGRVYESRNCPCCKPTRTLSLERDAAGEPVPDTDDSPLRF